MQRVGCVKGASRVNLCGVVVGQVLTKNNLGDERTEGGLNDWGGCEWDSCGDCKDLFGFATDEDLVRFFDDFLFP